MQYKPSDETLKRFWPTWTVGTFICKWPETSPYFGQLHSWLIRQQQQCVCVSVCVCVCVWPLPPASMTRLRSSSRQRRTELQRAGDESRQVGRRAGRCQICAELRSKNTNNLMITSSGADHCQWFLWDEKWILMWHLLICWLCRVTVKNY